MTANGHGRSFFCGDECVLELDSGYGEQLCKYTKNYRIVNFKSECSGNDIPLLKI